MNASVPTTDAQGRAWIERELVAIVDIASYSGEEHELVAHLEHRCADWGLPVRRLPVSSAAGAGAGAGAGGPGPGAADDLVIGPSDRPEVLLTAHLDTIRPTWEAPPAALRDGRVVGLGSQDDGAGIVAGILGLLLAREAGATLRSVALGLCVDEEMGGTGSIAMATSMRPPAVVALEGTDLRPALAEAGFAEVWLHVAGRPAHGAMREEGHNAIEEAHRMIARILDHEAARFEHPLLGRSIPMLWQIEGGKELNVVPERCSLHLDWRVTPGGPAASALLEWLRTAAAEHGAEVEVVEVVEPFETPADAPVAVALGRAIASVTGAEPERVGMPAWTDAHNFVDVGGAQAVVFGPGGLRGAHQPGESVAVDEVLTCARILAALVLDLNEGADDA